MALVTSTYFYHHCPYVLKMSSDLLFLVRFFFHWYLISWNCFLIDYRSEKRAQILSYHERLPSQYEVGIGECVTYK